MPLAMQTEHLTDLLKTLVETTSDDQGYNGVFLFTTRGEFGENPGETDLLVGISTNGTLYSTYYLPYDGGTLDPTFWPVSSVKSLITTFTPRAKEAEEHALRISQVGDGRIEIAEYDNPADGLKLIFNELQIDDFPLQAAKRLLRGEVSDPNRFAQNEMPIEDAGIELWDMAGLGKALAMAKKRKARLVVQKTITNAVCLLRMDKLENWRGAVLPVTPGEAVLFDEGVDAVDLHLDVELPETENVTV